MSAPRASLQSFLSRYSFGGRGKSNGQHTHTRIKGKDSPGGTFRLEKENMDEFYEKYVDALQRGTTQHLTERQLNEDCPLLVDLDLRYPTDVKSRQHTPSHVLDCVMLYAETLCTLYDIPEGFEVPVVILEKPDVNCQAGVTKDGIHLVFGVSVTRAEQEVVRSRVISDLGDIWDDLPVTNTWSDIVDDAVTKGSSNWQVYGSCKPDHKAYAVTGVIYLVRRDSQWSYTNKTIESGTALERLSEVWPDTTLIQALHKISARYTGWPRAGVRPGAIVPAARARPASTHVKVQNERLDGVQYLALLKTGSAPPLDAERLDNLLETMYDSANGADHKLKEAHQYVMCLSETYYGPGSYTKWIRVGWALANTSRTLFLTWLKFTSQAPCRRTLAGADGQFDWSHIAELYALWDGFDTGRADGLSHRSIMYWAKEDAPEKYRDVRLQTIDHFILETVNSTACGNNQSGHTDDVLEFDLAMVLYHICKDQYVCASIRRDLWYEYDGGRWREIDSGGALRLKISKDMYGVYLTHIQQTLAQLMPLEASDERYDKYRARSAKLSSIAMILKKTTWKNNIMREAKELFYDKHFLERLDQNPYLLCFNNGVVDFTQKRFRPGQPDDYVSKTTHLDYAPFDATKHGDVSDELDEFLAQLFPDEQLRAYMWDHLASVLIGTNDNQTFNIYTGSGRNGKSKIVELMGRCLGDYKGTVPITLITQKRTSIGSTSPEIVQLMGVRYAVMQEPSKGDEINEGIMKEITGGDPLQGRALFKDTVTFIPQFKLVVCTNTLFDIKSNDDGTWRRIRLVDYVSKFLDNPYTDPRFPETEFPYQFQLNKRLEDKFERWAPVLASRLVARALETNGDVPDSAVVMASSDKYRQGQDYLACFVNSCIERQTGGRVKKTELYEHFRTWYITHCGRGIPKAHEVYEHMDRRFGPYCKKPGKGPGWHDVAIVYDEDDEGGDEMFEDGDPVGN